jgi:HlyD family secretion protein
MRRAPLRLAWLAALAVAALSACSKQPPQALGTLEFDRITLPAPAAERIVRSACAKASRSRRDSRC